MSETSLELKTLPTDIEQTVDEYPEFDFETNEEFNLIFYIYQNLSRH